MDHWSELTEWWKSESQREAYTEEVVPLLLEMLEPGQSGILLDLGCGDGRMSGLAAEHTGAEVVGLDINLGLATEAKKIPVVLSRLPDLACLQSSSVDGAFSVLVLEHVKDRSRLFCEVARVVRPGGFMAVVINHPVYTAPESGPILDPNDGEIFWRFGNYLNPGLTTEPAGDTRVTFYHTSLAMLLNQAAQAGWCLEKAVEQGVGEKAAARDPILVGHRGIPHLMGLRWCRTTTSLTS